MAIPELIEQYVAGPALLRQAVKGMSREQLIARPVAGKWSTMEVVAHIADFEPILSGRILQVLSHERPLLVATDENLLAAAMDYQGRDIAEELNLIELTRKRMTRVLQRIKPDTASRIGIHTFKGLVTVESILQSAANHIPHHLPFIDEKRKALGV